MAEVTAYNPKTGEEVTLVGDQWVPSQRRDGSAPVSATTEALNTAREDAKKARVIAAQLERWDKLTDPKEKGGGGGWTGPAFGESFGGFTPIQDIAENLPGGHVIQELGSIADSLTPQQRPPGAGATSDFDARMYARGVPGVNKWGKANDSIVKHMQAEARRATEYQAFLERFLKERGTVLGADEAFEAAEQQRAAMSKALEGAKAPAKAGAERIKIDINGNPVR